MIDKITASASKVGNAICWFWDGVGEHSTKEEIRQKHSILKQKLFESKERKIYTHD